MSKYAPGTITMSDAQTTEAGTRWWQVFAGDTQIGTITLTDAGKYRARFKGERGTYDRLSQAAKALAELGGTLTGLDALYWPCDTCGAEQGYGCRTGSGHWSPSHADRLHTVALFERYGISAGL
jgi:hypothetical protein